MKRVTALLVLSLVLGVGAGVAQAAKADKAAKPAKADKQAKRDAKGVAGRVIKVNGTDIVVQTRGKKGGEVTIATDANTKFQVDGKEGTIDDVKAGENVVVSPMNGTAQKVLVKEAKGKKARKAKGAKPDKKA
jgi:hypothetical protein